MKNKRPEQIWRPVATLLLIIYIIVMIYLLFLSETMGRTGSHEIRYNLVPFREIGRYFSLRRAMWVLFAVNILGNIAAFVPLGAFLPILMPPGLKSGWFIITCGCVLSAIVELIQLITMTGSCDVDDIILNTIGTMIGYLLYFLCRALYIHLYRKRRAG